MDKSGDTDWLLTSVRTDFRTLCNALVGAHLKLPADPWAILVNGAGQGIAIQRRAPSVFQAGHGLCPPLIGLYMPGRYAGVCDDHDFKATAAGLAVRAGDFRCGKGFDIQGHS